MITSTKEPAKVIGGVVSLLILLIPQVPNILALFRVALDAEQRQALDALADFLPGVLAYFGYLQVRDHVWAPASVEALRGKLRSLIPEDKLPYADLI